MTGDKMASSMKCPKNGKTCYSTKARAKRGGNRLSKIHGVKYRAYICKFCSKYHLATRPDYRK